MTLLRLCISLLALGSARSATVPASPASSPRDAMYARVLPSIHASGVPAYLPAPSSLPHRAYPVLIQSQPGSYTLELSYVAGCAGHACEMGAIQAFRRPVRAHPLSGITVGLARGLIGHYYPFTCGANCGDSSVIVDIGAYRYVFGLKASDRAPVLRMTNSALSRPILYARLAGSAEG